MAPIEPDLSNSNIRPLSIFASYLTVATGLTFFISRSVLYRAFTSLPPSQATRLRSSSRQKHVILFASLALASLFATCIHTFGYFALSYKHWAHELGQQLPERLYGENGIVGDGSTSLALGRWLSDTELFEEAWEIIVERSRRYWWSQQILLGTAAWSVYLGVEGRKRNIRHLWSFMLLAQLVAVSFAMNLFFVAVLLTSVPLQPRGQSRTAGNPIMKQLQDKSTSSNPSSAVSQYSGKVNSALSSLAKTIRQFLPPVPNRPHSHAWKPYPLAMFAPLFVTYVCTFLLPYATSTPLFLPLILIPHLALFQPLYPQYLMPAAFGSTTVTDRQSVPSTLIAMFSFILHVKQSVVALLDSDPGAHVHRHSQYLAYLHLPHENERTKVYRSTTALSRVLGALNDHPAVSSVGWDVLMCGLTLGLWAAARGLEAQKILESIVFVDYFTFTKPPSTKPATTTKKRRRSSSKASKPAENGPDPSAEAKTPGRGSTRQKKKALKAEAEAEAINADPFVDAAAKDGGKGDKEYKDPTGGDDAVNGDGEDAFEGEEEMPENWEAAALAWGALVIGGLGTAAAGVLL